MTQRTGDIAAVAKGAVGDDLREDEAGKPKRGTPSKKAPVRLSGRGVAKCTRHEGLKRFVVSPQLGELEAGFAGRVATV